MRSIWEKVKGLIYAFAAGAVAVATLFMGRLSKAKKENEKLSDALDMRDDAEAKANAVTAQTVKDLSDVAAGVSVSESNGTEYKAVDSGIYNEIIRRERT